MDTENQKAGAIQVSVDREKGNTIQRDCDATSLKSVFDVMWKFIGESVKFKFGQTSSPNGQNWSDLITNINWYD